MKKNIICGLAIAPILFVGCVTTGTKVSETEVIEVQEEKIGGKITVVTNRIDAQDIFNEMEEKFKAKYPEVEDIIFESSSDYDNHIRERMDTNNYGDVLFVPFSMDDNPAQYMDYFEPLGNMDVLDDKYIDVTEADHDGIVYGLPVALNPLGIIYNEEVLKDAGVEKIPTTQEEMIEACKKIKENTNAIPFYTNYNNKLEVWGGALTSYGGEEYKIDVLEKGTAFKDGQPIRQVMDLFYNLSKNGLIEENPIEDDYKKSQQMIADGEVAMVMMGSQELVEINNLVTNGNKISIAPFPVEFDGGTSLALGAPSVVGISKNSENKATAKAFMEFMVSQESGYANDLAGISPVIADLDEETAQVFKNNKVVLTAPPVEPAIDKIYGDIANEVGAARLNSIIQRVINIGLYPDQNESYDVYVANLEKKWAEAASEFNQ